MSVNRPYPDQPIVRPRMPELDVIRGIAIVSVVVFHGFGDALFLPAARPAWQQAVIAVVAQGWAGVNLFFVLSGFLITGILLDSAHQAGYYARFYTRRALRILPAYYLALILVLSWNYFWGAPARTVWEFGALSVVYLSNVSVMFGVAFLYPVLWSLSVEEHFYLLWPALVRNVSRRGMAIVAALICAIEPLLRWYDLGHGGNNWWAGSHHAGSYVYTWMMADGLALGALLALFGRSRWGSRRNLIRVGAVAFALAVAATAASGVVSRPLSFCLRGTVVNYFSLALIAGALWLGTGAHSRWVHVPLLAFFGYISYGLYLMHAIVFSLYYTVTSRWAPSLMPGTDFAKIWLTTLVCGAIATAVAYLSRATFEEFFLRMKPGERKPATAKGATVAA